MKRTAILLFSSLILCFSCSDANDQLQHSDVHGKWQLVKMTGSFVGSETTGDDMEWQEFYVFNRDNSFSRTRTRNGEVTLEGGTFSAGIYNDGTKYFSLIYPNDSQLAGSCFGTEKEELVFATEHILSSTWQACDGPGLDYKKVSD